ncbi:hypothetical protein [uncultured Agrococcus sp.]|uniref:hypothetical protein n=1 Tax=uncultured Agrococcus sp. TaxID=382258 RepID=UPI0025E4F61B|nr:hypothetical protein [uncultured Agrococcus sp.]
MTDQNDQPQGWRDRLFGENRAETEDASAAEQESANETTRPEGEVADERQDDAAQHEEQQRAWQAAFDGDDSPSTAEYRPSPASAPAPDAEVEPRVVLPSSLRGDNPTGEMDEMDADSSPELVEPARPQLSLRRRERAIEDAKEAERAVSGDEEKPLADAVHEDAAQEPAAEAHAEDTVAVDEQETVVVDESTRAMDAVEFETEPTPEETVQTEPEADATARFVAQQQATQFVEEPEAPRKRGARGTGLSVALLSTVVFAGLFGVLIYGYLFLVTSPETFDPNVIVELWLLPSLLFASAAFLIGYIILTLIVNRAGWWAHVLGGFIVALLVYAATVVGLNFEANGGWDAGFGEILTFTREGIRESVFAPVAIIAFVLAREVPIWLGGIVGRRGRKQRERYDAELAEHRERYGLNED